MTCWAFPAVGKTEPQRIFELLGQKGEVTPEHFALRNAYVVALNAYRGRLGRRRAPVSRPAWPFICAIRRANCSWDASHTSASPPLVRIGAASGRWRRIKLHGGAVSLFRNRKQFR
jgi:hypothetical protein